MTYAAGADTEPKEMASNISILLIFLSLVQQMLIFTVGGFC